MAGNEEQKSLKEVYSPSQQHRERMTALDDLHCRLLAAARVTRYACLILIQHPSGLCTTVSIQSFLITEKHRHRNRNRRGRLARGSTSSGDRYQHTDEQRLAALPLEPTQARAHSPLLQCPLLAASAPDTKLCHADLVRADRLSIEQY